MTSRPRTLYEKIWDAHLVHEEAGQSPILYIDRQYVLPYGTPEEVRAAVRTDLAALATPAGGYIGRGEAAGDVPLENLEALYDEVTHH